MAQIAPHPEHTKPTEATANPPPSVSLILATINSPHESPLHPCPVGLYRASCGTQCGYRLRYWLVCHHSKVPLRFLLLIKYQENYVRCQQWIMISGGITSWSTLINSRFDRAGKACAMEAVLHGMRPPRVELVVVSRRRETFWGFFITIPYKLDTAHYGAMLLIVLERSLLFEMPLGRDRRPSTNARGRSSPLQGLTLPERCDSPPPNPLWASGCRGQQNLATRETGTS